MRQNSDEKTTQLINIKKFFSSDDEGDRKGIAIEEKKNIRLASICTILFPECEFM